MKVYSPSGEATTGRRGGRKTPEALARLHSGGSLNRSHAFTAEGRGSSLAPTGRRSFVERLLLVVGNLRDNQAEFVTSLSAKMQQYGDRAFVSPAQLFWLRDLQKYVPDERQESLF